MGETPDQTDPDAIYRTLYRTDDEHETRKSSPATGGLSRVKKLWPWKR
jgi:hypothetical protein